MRIAIISHGASGGGSERVATILANYLAECGNEIYFLAVHSKEREYFLREDIHYKYIDIGRTIKPFRLCKRAKVLKEYLMDNSIETMVSFIYSECLGAFWLRNIKKIYSLRNDPHRTPKTELKIIKILYKYADAVVFQTEDAKAYFDETIRNHGIVIPNPIKPNLPTWDEKHSEKTIIAAGRLSKQKNFSILLEAFAAFVKKFPDYKLSICGEGKLEYELRHKAKELGIENKVSFEGHVTDLHERMSKAQIYISSSDYEGMSNSMLEALAIGIPAICTDCPVGGARMFITDGENGFLTKVGHANDMFNHMVMLAENEKLRKQFSDESKKIREQLDASVVCKKWKTIIEGC
ncbi:glycosyltransferase [Oribacterium sp. P6A1]|uniref:glycosyltransferase n=1 Tax=Oribacterium sp. P6A1 TaxID=1410612 RepID=UPI0006913867|nr:glycosyltransferase [Oribacterium sp. P6A1]